MRTLATVVAILILHAPVLADAIKVERGVAQLFVDDHLIDTQSDLKRILHRPKKDGGGETPILAIEGEYGDVAATLEANGSIVYDPRLKRWVMFALAYSSPTTGAGRTRLYRFTSPDAISWVKGDGGKPQPVQFDLVDAKSGRKAVGYDLFSCFYDTRDSEHPYKGWLYYWNWEELEGLYFVRSRDGLTWERGVQVSAQLAREIRQDGRTLRGPSDVTVFAPDPASGRFLASIKFYSPERVGPGNALRSRAYAFVDRLDAPLDVSAIGRVALVPSAAEAGGDQPHDEYYASTAWRYESLYLGGLKIWHGGGDYPHSAAGCAFYKLAVSRDGLNWQQIPFANDAGVPGVFIPNGPEGGNDGRNDGGYMTEFSQGPLRVGDELIYYYGASSWGKNHPNPRRVSGGGIFRARLRVGGFVSVDAGTLTTKRLQFPRGDLYVNAVGPVTVSVLDEEERELSGAVIAGDSLQHTLALDERATRLRFAVGAGGKLYSFSVR